MLNSRRGARRAACVVGILSGLLAVIPIYAQEPADTTARDTAGVRLQGIIVRPTRPIAPIGGAGAVLIRPDSLRLAAAPTLEDVLREVPFVRVRDNSRGEVELSVRGSESRQVAVLVDGVPLTLGWDHRTDASVVPITGARSMVLVRGLSSLLHGPNVLGGVIEVNVSQSPFDAAPPPPLQLRASVDQTGGRAVGAVGAAPLAAGSGTLLLRAGAGYRSRPGFPLPSGVRDLGPANDGLRTNSDVEHADGFFSLRYGGGQGEWVSLSSSAYRARRGVPPETHLQEPRLWRYPDAARLLAVVSGGTGQRRTPWGEGDLEASVGVDLGHTEIDSYETLAYDALEGGEAADDRTVTVRLLGDHTLPAAGELRGALTLADVNHDEILEPGSAFRYGQRLWSAATEVAYPIGTLAGSGLSGLRVSGGFALDGADTPESGDKPALGTLSAWGGRIGASAVAGSGAVLLHTSVSRRARFPSLRELYSGALGRFVPNPDLRPERLLAGEMGVSAQAERWELQAVGFHHRLSDAIVRASAGDGRFRRENRDQIRSTGIELLGGWTAGRASIGGELTLQRVRVLDPTVPGGARRAEYQPALSGALAAALPLPRKLRLDADLAYLGRQWCVHPDLDREVALDPSTRLDLQLNRSWKLRRPGAAGPLPGTLRTSFALNNVADAAVFDQCGLPQPGRTLRFQVELT